jgi:preprotein translocase subunit YajC
MGSQVSVTPKGSAGTSPAQQASNPLISFFPLILVFGIFYMLVIRPQQKQARAQRQMVDNLKTGDRVLTQGGLYGTVVGLRGLVIQLKIAENVRVEINRSAVTQVITNVSEVTTAPPLEKIVS